MRSHVLACSAWLLARAGLSSAADATPPGFDWSAVAPSPDLRYHPCYDGFQCARLSVPRDWLGASGGDSNNNKTVALAVIALPAAVGPDDPRFGGTIITNPGGPGGSGVDFLRGHGRRLRRMTGGRRRHYELLSFDPRGVGRTWPRVDCFGDGGHGGRLARDAFQLEQRGAGGMAAGDSALRRFLALYDGLGGLCRDRDRDRDEDIQAYVSTASVARDIVEIADRVEEHRQAGKRLGSASSRHGEGQQRPMGAGTEGESKTPPRVMYWGFSYGTVLGNTLASMFPGRMGRVVLDGVVDINDYMRADWLRNLLDTEKVVDYFYESCLDAAGRCPLWRAGDASGADIRGRVDAMISGADARPVSLLPAGGDDAAAGVRVVTGHDLRGAFVRPVYRPLPSLFRELAVVLAEALGGNYSLVGAGLAGAPRLEDACAVDDDNSTAAAAAAWPGDAQMAVLCGDASRRASGGQREPLDDEERRKFSFWQQYVAKVVGQSPTLGSYWSQVASGCSGWRITPKWIFNGPWVTPPANPNLQEDAPAAPILFTSTRLDPVTPLANAYQMSSNHPGSSVLVLDSVGHCAMPNGWSECFNEALRAYFDDGIVPENGTVCADTACRPFVDGGECEPPPVEGLRAARSVEDDKSGMAGIRPLGIPL